MRGYADAQAQVVFRDLIDMPATLGAFGFARFGRVGLRASSWSLAGDDIVVGRTGGANK
jgi:hypothetical protein